MLWHPDGQLPLRKKGHGRSIMVSEFLSELEGPLKTIDDNGEVIRAREIINPGKNYDGYWTAEDMARQFKKAIAIHKRNHPNRIGLWAFDNSSNHNCVAKDALVVNRMNLSSGGKQAAMRDTIVDGIHYTMVFPDDFANESLRGNPKGMKEVLKDRGLWIHGLPKTCSRCRADDKHLDRVDCCAERILELQPDFVAQRSMLEEIAREEGQLIIFYPKFHCELNFIEMYWGASKRYTRKHCDYSFQGLQSIIPEALDSVPIETIRRFSWKAFRYMDAYRKGLTMGTAERAVKQYKSHRRISENQMLES